MLMNCLIVGIASSFYEACVLFILLLDLIIFSRLLRLAFADSLSMVRPLFCNGQHLVSVAQLC